MKKFTANNASDRVDLGSALKTGENTIVIKLTTALYGRAFVENHMYANTEFDGGMSFGIRVPYVNGLTNVTLTPYSRIPLN